MLKFGGWPCRPQVCNRERNIWVDFLIHLRTKQERKTMIVFVVLSERKRGVSLDDSPSTGFLPMWNENRVTDLDRATTPPLRWWISHRQQAKTLLKSCFKTFFWVFVRHWETACTGMTLDELLPSAICVQKFGNEWFCNWYHLSHFAAFFNEIGSQVIHRDTLWEPCSRRSQITLFKRQKFCCFFRTLEITKEIQPCDPRDFGFVFKVF